jgi:hypothetical protein
LLGQGERPVREPSFFHAGVAALLAAFLFPAAAMAGEPAAPWLLDALSNAVQSNAGTDGAAPVAPTLGTFTGSVGRRLFDAGPADLEKSELKATFDAEDRPLLHGRSLLSLETQDSGAVLLQGNVKNAWEGERASAKGGVGLGMRRLLDGDEWLAGANAFVDDGWRETVRGSFGGEIQSAPLGLRANVYRPYADGPYGRAASGYDFSVRVQVPYVPAASVSFDATRWSDGSAELAPADKLALTFRPLSFLTIDGGMRPSANEPTAYSVGVRFTLPLDGSRKLADAPLVDDRPFRAGSMAGHTLDAVRRKESVPTLPRERP